MNKKNTAQTQKEEREEVLKEIRQLEDVYKRQGTALKYRKPRRIYGTLCWVHTPTFWKIRLLEMTVT